ncbi:sensor histidine kinase [Mangrovibacterium diazotrophicum]|uniref:Histidine kinase n=1 Tax=Mangrovibacterium diazotrophicum TaxID=1261403 RepID=A0A419W907_9BACT|nr:histidine kinase [Mangrovibacterium diazotrophicum]RKD91951.1 histidine kinase [Mangrovibacterium diazotrophicum]
MKPQVEKTKLIKIQIWIVVGSFLFTLLFEFMSGRRFFSDYFISIFLLMIAQIEIYGWIGKRMLEKLEYNSVREFTRIVLVKLVMFYVLVILISICLFVMVGVLSSVVDGIDPMIFIRNILWSESRGFILGSGIGLLLGSVIFFVAQLFSAIRRMQKLQEEKLIYQYQTLKNQVNPHFLFNSLNTLSTLVHTDADLADEFIQKLASTYRYVLDHNQQVLVQIEEELRFVQSYFYLHQLRGKEKFRLNIDADIPEKLFVLPVSIQLLVENALKHNAATNEKPLVINISADTDGYIRVSNNKQAMQTLEHSTGTGLNNLAERVRQICGRDLVLRETYDEFTVKIPIMESDESRNR